MEETIELIEKYLAGTLSSEEESRFHSKVKTDTVFANRFRLIQQLMDAAKPDTDAFIKMLDDIHADYKKEKNLSLFLNRKYYAFAAAFLILFGSIAVIFLLSKRPDPQQLFAQHFSIPAENISLRADQEENESLKRALEAYNSGQYSAALNYFNQIEQADDAVLFYQAICKLAEGDVEAAALAFERLMQSKSAYQTAARWYGGLAYIKLNELDKGKRTLEVLAQEPGSNYAPKARELLDQLP